MLYGGQCLAIKRTYQDGSKVIVIGSMTTPKEALCAVKNNNS